MAKLKHPPSGDSCLPREFSSFAKRGRRPSPTLTPGHQGTQLQPTGNVASFKNDCGLFVPVHTPMPWRRVPAHLPRRAQSYRGPEFPVAYLDAQSVGLSGSSGRIFLSRRFLSATLSEDRATRLFACQMRRHLELTAKGRRL